MGRYTTVQAFKDTDTRVPALSYEVATGRVLDEKSGELVELNPTKPEDEYDEHGRKKGLTEKVVNAYGSTAGAGSGEYHAYRHSRDRENARLDRLVAAKAKKDQMTSWERKLARNKEECDARTDKRRNERKRKKEAKRLAKIRKDLNAKAGITDKATGGGSGGGSRGRAPAASDGGQDKRARRGGGGAGAVADEAVPAAAATVEPPRNKNVIPNDGSFLATFGKIA